MDVQKVIKCTTKAPLHDVYLDVNKIIMGNIAGRDVNIIIMVYFKDMP
jgi:hypothetical protein